MATMNANSFLSGSCEYEFKSGNAVHNNSTISIFDWLNDLVTHHFNISPIITLGLIRLYKQLNRVNAKKRKSSLASFEFRLLISIQL